MSIIIKNENLINTWEYFDIMHKDRRVLRIYKSGKCKIYFKSFMPYNLYVSLDDDIDSRVNNLNNFYYWCSSRVLMLDRKYAKEILNSIGANQAVTDKDRALIAISYHGLSLTDVYWIRGKKEKIEFSDISLFDHSLSNSFTDVCLRGKSITVQNAELMLKNDASGNVSLQGMAAKAWIREDDAFYLLKDGDKRDVNSEVLASKIIDCFDIDHVNYEYSNYSGEVVSKCKIITSEDLSIVPFEYINIYCLNKEIDAYEYILKKDSYSYYMMNVIDYLIGNTDRHWGNWGFYCDNENNKLKTLYPLMDFNKAFTAYDTIEGAISQTTKEKMSQKDAAIIAIKKVGLNMVNEIDPKLFNDNSIKDMFFERLNLLKSV